MSMKIKLKTAAALSAFAALAVVSVNAGAADTDPGIYGRIDTSRFPHPKASNRRPVVADRAARKSAGQPVYLHVRLGEEWHWHALCGSYGACSEPVYFVTESWFRGVYLPAIGSHDGREQHYREQVARDRPAGGREEHDHDLEIN